MHVSDQFQGVGLIVLTQRQDGGGFYIARVDQVTNVTIGQVSVTFLPPQEPGVPVVAAKVFDCYAAVEDGVLPQKYEAVNPVDHWDFYEEVIREVMVKYYRAKDHRATVVHRQML